MSDLIKYGLALVVIILIGLPLIAQLGKDDARPSTDAQASAETAPAEPDAPPTLPAISQAQFSLAQPGMTYEDCVRAIGVEGVAIDASKWGNAGLTAAYRWADVAGTNEYVLGFRDGRLASKSMGMSQAGQAAARERLRAMQAQTSVIDDATAAQLELAARQSGQHIVITLEEFASIRPGMTYDECVAVIGEGNAMAQGYANQRRATLSGQSNLRTFSEGYRWSNPGGYYAEITFQNGRVSDKSWKQGPAGGGGFASGSFGGVPER